MVKCSAWRLLLLQSVLTAGVLSQGDFSLEDALDPDVPPTARGRTTKAPPSLLPTNPKGRAPPPRPATPRPGNDFDLADALLPSNDKPEKPNRKNQGGGISDDDLFGLVKDEDYKPDKGKGNQPSDGEKGQTDLTGSGAEVGTIGGIVSAVAMALVGAVTSYISYQKKKLCFGIQQSLNVDVMKSEAPDAVVATEPQVQQSLMETKAERPPSEDNNV
ncbi:CD99 antigen-like protein 2 isoform X1 [Gadus morhua]|uniref:CD99 antigen-like protein 2 isoform X1 n=1 Tax=Gadus morhua TaxID=8049 RepID=UPI0011B37DE9|nr:CD99 antigen-like protein 2 isoform X1 [Gadus morhua]